MTTAWIALDGGGWTMLQAELLDGRVITTTTPAIGYTGPCACRPVSVLSNRGGAIVEVETALCGCTGAVARLLPPGVTDEQIAAARAGLTRRLLDDEALQ